MQFNFSKKRKNAKPLQLILLILLSWTIIFRNYYLSKYIDLDALTSLHQRQHLAEKPSINPQILKKLLQMFLHLNCQVKRIDIYQHMLILQGSLEYAEDFLLLWRLLKDQSYLQSLSFLKWEREGREWRFSIKAYY